MPKRLFITGSSGFIGSKLVKRLENHSFESVYCLYRNPDGLEGNGKTNSKLRLVQGDLCDTDSYVRYLESSDTVIHLAAATGKAPREEYSQINVNGTQVLLDECRRAGVERFLFISTIAVKYKDKTRYYYAQSKEAGEEAVKDSGLKYTIVRPTIVIGDDSTIWKNLAGLSKGSIIPVFGDGKNLIQPIHVEDLVSCIVSILDDNLFSGDTFELGGADIITFEDFLSIIHLEYSKSKPRFLHIPFIPLKTILSFFERYFYSVLPVTVGQLSVFNNNGVIQANDLHDRHVAEMKSIQEMVSIVVRDESKQAQYYQLERECKAFTKFLINDEPTNYIRNNYQKAHQISNIFDGNTNDPFDDFLIMFSARNGLYTKLADSYASFFYKNSLLRKKLVLLLAILESSAPSYRQFEGPDSSSVLTILYKLFLKGVIFAMSFIGATILIMPVRFLYSIRAKNTANMGET
jgi:NADH dehydrogenase